MFLLLFEFVVLLFYVVSGIACVFVVVVFVGLRLEQVVVMFVFVVVFVVLWL